MKVCFQEIRSVKTVAIFVRKNCRVQMGPNITIKYNKKWNILFENCKLLFSCLILMKMLGCTTSYCESNKHCKRRWCSWFDRLEADGLKTELALWWLWKTRPVAAITSRSTPSQLMTVTQSGSKRFIPTLISKSPDPFFSNFPARTNRSVKQIGVNCVFNWDKCCM